MKDLAVAAIIAFGAVGLCVLVYYIEVIIPVRKEQKHFWNPFTQSFDTKQSKSNYLPKETIRKFK